MGKGDHRPTPAKAGGRADGGKGERRARRPVHSLSTTRSLASGPPLPRAAGKEGQPGWAAIQRSASPRTISGASVGEGSLVSASASALSAKAGSWLAPRYR